MQLDRLEAKIRDITGAPELLADVPERRAKVLAEMAAARPLRATILELERSHAAPAARLARMPASARDERAAIDAEMAENRRTAADLFLAFGAVAGAG